MSQWILWFDEIGMNDLPRVGGKNASLGEMYRELSSKGVNIPYGFAITVDAYHYLLDSSGMREKVEEQLRGLDVDDLNALQRTGSRIRQIIQGIEFPDDLKDAILSSYRKLCDRYGEDTDVAVRSSATAEDLPDASFAGQQDTYLNIQGEVGLISACKKCFASLFTNRAITYREHKQFNHFDVGLSIAVQKMVRSDLACSGIMFTLDTESGFRDVVFITGSYGLGENIVQGIVNPDEFYVFKPTLAKGYRSIIQKYLGRKEFKMIYSMEGTAKTKDVPVPQKDRDAYILNDDEILQLARWAVIIEDHYSKLHQRDCPMDIEWAKDGITQELFIVQARPETVKSRDNELVLENYELKERGKLLLVGKSVGEKIGVGKVNIIQDVKDIVKFNEGEVLVTEMTDPDWEPIMKKAAAIVTSRGGRTCHAAIISRELGVPCVVGTGNACEILRDYDYVTVSCAEGETGYVYEGLLEYDINRVNLESLERPKTKIMMNVGNPDNAFALSFIPNDGVGLAREEFIISNYIQIHPLALARFNSLKDEEVIQKIKEITRAYSDKKQFFVDKLARGIAKIAAAFYPKDVIVRLSDFKTNEYANLIGGKYFEPEEHNPMLGFRGASRYYDPNYKDAFALECAAILKARDEMGLTNIKVMVPFCRTVEEGKKVLKIMEEFGLKQGANELEVYVMCEVPSNVIMAEEFCQIFDGFSIGSNDLTQLTLGLDRDSANVAHIFDERDPAVKRMVRKVIEVARRNNVKIGICGQAPSDYPEFAEFLVECGINSISLNPDTVIKTTTAILETERRLNK